MRQTHNYILLTIIMLTFLFGCSNNPADPNYQKEISVFGYLWGNKRLTIDHAIFISYSQPITDYYDLNEAAIHNAVVKITESSTKDVYILNDTPEKPGFFFNDSLQIKPNTTYQLQVEVDGKIATASTTVPPILVIETELFESDTVNNVIRTNLGYEKPVYLNCESENQIIVVDMFCNEPYDNAEYIYPFHDEHKFPEDQEEYDGGVNGEPRRIQALVPYQDLISDEYPGEHVVYWYSSMIVFYGSNTMQVLAIDDNYHKFIYSEHPEFSGGINGGIGVFGSVCGKIFELMVNKD